MPRRHWETATAFLACAAVVALYALRGGTFDVVPRAELGIAAWWAVALGWAIGVLPRSRPGLGGWLPLAGLALLALWTAVSLAWTESDERTMAELARIAHHAGLLALALSLVSPRSWRAMVAGTATGALVVCALAVASRLWPAAFPVDRVGASFGASRLSYPLNYWNAVAAWGAMSATVALSLSAHAVSVRARMLLLAAVPVALVATYLTYSRAGLGGLALGALLVWATARHRAVLAVHVVVAAVGAGGVIAVIRAHPAIARAEGGQGHGAVLAALAAAAALGAVTAWWTARGDERWRLSPRVAHRLSALGAVAAIAAGGLALPPAVSSALSSLHDRRTAVTQADPDPAARLGSLSGARVEVWSSAFAAFRSAPFHGTGAGTFEFWWSRDARDPEYMVDAHSLYLESLAELGLPGLAAVLLLCLGGLSATVRARLKATTASEAGAASACLAGLAVWLLHAGVDWMWESTATVAFALLLAAASAGALTRGQPATEPVPPARRTAPARLLRVPVRCAVVLVAALALAVQLPVLVGASSLRVSQAAARGHDDRRAEAAAEDAAAALPWAATPHDQLALLAEARGDLGPAEREARRAVALEPTNWRHRLLLARVLAGRGEAAPALAAYAAAERLHPLGPMFSASSAPGR